MDNKLNGDPGTKLSIDKEGKRLIVPTPCDGTLYPLAMVTEGK